MAHLSLGAVRLRLLVFAAATARLERRGAFFRDLLEERDVAGARPLDVRRSRHLDFIVLHNMATKQ